MAANAVCVSVLASYSKFLFKQPAVVVRTLIAAGFFSLFMESFHMNVGPSELHFVGAMIIYLGFGFLPTLFGFALGLLLQGLLFEPGDLPYLAVNSLSLIVPLIAVHYAQGRSLFQSDTRRPIGWPTILRLDGMYYAGVTLMVGLWLLGARNSAPFAAWAHFALSYLALVACEPFFTYASVRLLKRHQQRPLVALCTAVGSLDV